jgi:hypothetical protein
MEEGSPCSFSLPVAKTTDQVDAANPIPSNDDG